MPETAKSANNKSSSDEGSATPLKSTGNSKKSEEKDTTSAGKPASTGTPIASGIGQAIEDADKFDNQSKDGGETSMSKEGDMAASDFGGACSYASGSDGDGDGDQTRTGLGGASAGGKKSDKEPPKPKGFSYRLRKCTFWDIQARSFFL